jgi:hypothetical protein
LLIQGHLAGIVRLGYRMPQDFGPTMLRGMNVQPPPRRNPSDSASGGKSLGFALHAGVGANLVFHDLTLNGNTFRDSPDVSNELFVPGVMVGLEIGNRHFLATLQYIWLGKEFERQQSPASFGVLTLSYFF